MIKRRVLLLSTGSANAHPVLWCLKRAGYRAFVLGNASRNSSPVLKLMCEKFYAIPEKYTFESNSPEVAGYIKDIAKRDGIDIIVPSGFESVKFLSRYSDELSVVSTVLSVPSAKNIDMLGNKHNFSVFCRSNGISHPRTYLLEDIDSTSVSNMGFGFPVMTKPLDMASSKGVRRFDSDKELRDYLRSGSADGERALPILLQEYIPGSDVGFNVFATDGRINGWAIQHFMEIERKGREPFKWLRFGENKAVFLVGKSIIEKSRYTGPANIDMRIDSRDGSVRAIEVNPRFWATTARSLCDGVNFIDVAIRSTADPSYRVEPLCSNKMWGNFWRIPILAVQNRDVAIFRHVPSFSMVQISYMLDNFFMKILSGFTRISTRKKTEIYGKD